MLEGMHPSADRLLGLLVIAAVEHEPAEHLGADQADREVDLVVRVRVLLPQTHAIFGAILVRVPEVLNEQRVAVDRELRRVAALVVPVMQLGAHSLGCSDELGRALW